MSEIDDYLDGFDGPVRERLEEMRTLIRALAPEATEAIAYGVPTFKLNGNLVHYGGAAQHVGFYPGAAGVALVAAELDDLGLPHSKGTIQLPLDRPLPVELITRVVTHRLEQQRAKARTSRRRK